MRRVLLDTQVFIAAYLGDSLPGKVRQLLSDPAVERLVSTASLLEIAIKNTIGKIQMTQSYVSQAAQDLAATILPVNTLHALRVFRLPPHHRDPFDRAIIATALVESVPLIGGDRLFQRYAGLTVIWA
jgi:putative PIN family toxin of toxin-antitoxin system